MAGFVATSARSRWVVLGGFSFSEPIKWPEQLEWDCIELAASRRCSDQRCSKSFLRAICRSLYVTR